MLISTIGQLAEAVISGDGERVRAILTSAPLLVNASGEDGRTALHIAVMGRMEEMVRLLLRCGANPGAGIGRHSEATTPLAMARDRGYGEMEAMLRPSGIHDTEKSLPNDEERVLAMLESAPGRINTGAILHAAAARGWRRVASWVLDHGGDVNSPSADGSTPLDLAGWEMAEWLRARGAEVTPRGAVILGDLEFLRAKGEELKQPRDDRRWLLRLAVEGDRPDILRELLDFGLDPDARVRVEEEGEVYTWGMPLYACVRAGKHAMAEMLLERGADANGQVYASGTPLSEAYGQRDEAMIALLVRFGGQPNASMAGLYRRKDLAIELLEKHGDARLPDDGFSSGPVAEQLLGAAARGGDAEILRLAIERVSIPAVDRRWNGLLAAPLGFWNHWYGPWCHQEWDRGTYLECFRMLLERSGPPNQQFRNGVVILHEIATMGDHVTAEERVAFAAAALDAGARLDIRDDLLKSTPLGWAARWGRTELVRLYLDREADALEEEAEPWARPLAWAERRGHAAIAALLRDREAK